MMKRNCEPGRIFSVKGNDRFVALHYVKAVSVNYVNL